MRHTRSHTKNRRSHHALKAPTLSKCAHCDGMHRPHHMCLECGFYKGRQIMDIGAEKEKREARMKAKRDRIKAENAQEEAEQETPESHGAVVPPEVDTSKEAREENLQSKRPEKKPE